MRPITPNSLDELDQTIRRLGGDYFETAYVLSKAEQVAHETLKDLTESQPEEIK